jgi:hypothetical protein
MLLAHTGVMIHWARLYQQHRVRDEIAIVLPGARAPEAATGGGQELVYRFEFGDGSVRIMTGAQSVRSEGDMLHRVAASALVGWIERRKSFFYVRAYSLLGALRGRRGWRSCRAAPDRAA